MGKLKILTNQLVMVHRQNAPKVFMFSIIILIYGYHLLLLTLLKTCMETSYFTKMFYQKQDESCIDSKKNNKKQKTKKKHVKKPKDGEKD